MTKLTGRGGPGRRQGRKPSQWPKQVIIIACTEAEKQEILKLDPRQRAERLLLVIEK